MHEVDFPPDQFWHCTFAMMGIKSAILSSTLLITAMTFERFYSIIRPHKAASFNTVKRAKGIILIIVCSSIIFNIPQFYTTALSGKGCIPYAGGFKTTMGVAYYWVSLFITFIFPFISLLVMNGVIINTFHKRPVLDAKVKGQVQGHKMVKVKVKLKVKFKNLRSRIVTSIFL